uniref:Receptor expression-enhancing protein n=1 Tax=Syphacia muris TaxID=451379 RepID=A0A0N5A9N1_9BILA
MSASIPSVQKFLDDLDKKLHETNAVTEFLGTLEARTGIRRLHIVLAIVLTHAVYLIFGYFAELLCNLIGFLYPAYVSIRAVESANKEDDTQWLTYWIIFALFNFLDFFSGSITKYFPIYWLAKCMFFLWLYMPMTLGAQKIYHGFVRPFLVYDANQSQGSADAARREFVQHVKPN